MGELASRGAEFATDPVTESFGRIVFMKVPGGGRHHGRTRARSTRRPTPLPDEVRAT